MVGALAASSLVAGQAQAASLHTVVCGESLYKIGVANGVDYHTLLTANHLTSTTIYPGQKLFVPSAGWPYTVQPGDSLWKLSKRFGPSIEAIKAANGLHGDTIYIGQCLSIPQKASTALAPQPKAKRASTALAPAKPTSSRGGQRPQQNVVAATAQERSELARIIAAEAGGDPEITQLGVGAVILNRVKSPSFPNTIHDVIFQVTNGHYQFTPILNGWYWNVPVTQEQYAVADRVLQGEDPTHGALYFWDSGAIQNSYLLSLPVQKVLGTMTFAR